MPELQNARLAPSGRGQTDHVLFIGSAFVFPDVMLRLARIEFEGLGASRIDAPDLPGSLDDTGRARLVIIEDRLAEALERNWDLIRQRLSGAPIALAYGDPAVARRLLALQQHEGRLSGLRFLPLDAPLTGWVSMLRLLLAGTFVVPGDLMAPDAGPAPTPAATAQAPDMALTPRQLEVLDRVALGHRNKAIAEALGVSEHTVKLHLHHIITRIGVDNRTAAANWYLAHGGAGHPAP